MNEINTESFVWDNIEKKLFETKDTQMFYEMCTEKNLGPGKSLFDSSGTLSYLVRRTFGATMGSIGYPSIRLLYPKPMKMPNPRIFP